MTKIEAFDMAIEALQAKTDGDLISRADAMGAVQDHFNADGFKGYDDGQKMMDRINALPSAEVKTKCVAQIKVDTEEIVKRIKEENGMGLLFPEIKPDAPDIGDEVIVQGVLSLIQRYGDGTMNVEIQNVKAIMKV